jgi:GTPase
MKRSLVGHAKRWGMGMDTVKLRGILADLIRARIALGAGRSSEKITIEQAQRLIGLSHDALTDAVVALRDIVSEMGERPA